MIQYSFSSETSKAYKSLFIFRERDEMVYYRLCDEHLWTHISKDQWDEEAERCKDIEISKETFYLFKVILENK